MIKGVKSVEEYKILKWVDEHFAVGSVKVTFCFGHGVVEDANGSMLVVKVNPDSGKVEVCEE